VLCNKILKKNEINSYNLVDIEAARIANEKQKLGGIFHVRDLNNGIDISLPNKVDLFIANDFLEHIQNPAKTVLDIKKLMTDDGLAFISVPNWRMGHAWIYRGLFDWDNFIHFMWQHGFELEGYVDSPLKCSPLPRLVSESSMPEDLLNSWNLYILFKRNDNE
jgi:SAM-dependent methyltransferase